MAANLNMMLMKKVSIITVSFNSESTIRDTIESVISQDYPCIEYIIIDGGSKDRTMGVIREYDKFIDIVISEQDKGIYDGMNKGIHVATGDVVALLNSDDIYADNTSVSRLIECMETAGTDTVFADLVLVHPRDMDRVVRYYDSSTFHPNRLRYGWMPAHPTFLAKREIYMEWGDYSLDYQIAADFEMMVRLLHKAKVSYAYLPEVAVKMRAGGVSTSGLRSSWILNNEIVTACRANGLGTNLFRVLLKIPAKLLEYLKNPKYSVTGDSA